MSPKDRKCVPLSVKLKILEDQEKGFGPKVIMKRYRVKKSTYYRILSEKKAIRAFALGEDSNEFKDKVVTDDEQEVDSLEKSEDTNKIESQSTENTKVNGDEEQSIDGVNKAVLDWYNEQKAEGVSVDDDDINGAAERLARELGFTHFKVNSGWPLRFRKPQATTDKTAALGNMDGGESIAAENPGLKVKKALRIQDQITAFQRLQAGESAKQIGNDFGVSKTTIQRVKKKLKDTLFTPSLDPNYYISVESLKTKKKSENAVREDPEPIDKLKSESMEEATYDLDSHKESVWAAIERRKRLLFNKNAMSNKDRGLSYNEKIAAIAQYKAGVTLKQIAHNFGVSTSTIQRVKKKFSKSHKLQYKNYMKLEQKVRVLERLEEGETIMEIAEDLGVHDTTIRAIKKSKLKIMNVYRASRSSLNASSSNSSKAFKYEKMEKRLLAWINDLRRRKIPMSSAMIQKKALMIQMHISQEEGGSSSQNFIPSKEWLAGFQRRHNIQKICNEESGESASESDNQRFMKAAPKSKKIQFAARRGGGNLPNVSQHTPLLHKESMNLSKLAEGLREMYLSSTLPPNPYRCNSFTPRVILIHLEPKLLEKYTKLDTVKTEPLSDEETWLTAHTNAGSDSDWGEQNWDTNSLTEMSNKSVDSQKKKRKKPSSEYSRKRRRLLDGNESDGDRSVVDYNGSNYMNVPIKQEPPSSVDSLPPNVPMAVLPAGSTYVPPLPMFQVPSTGLTVFMPESQQMMMQHPVNYSHDNSSDLFMNQQQIRGRTIVNSPSSQFNHIHSEANMEPNMRQGNENVIMMPYGRDLCEQEKSKQLPSSDVDSVVCDTSAEKTRKERAAAIAENIGMTVEESSHKKLRDLTFKLLELNNKNLICDDRIERAKEEYEKTVAHNEAEKRINDKEIDKVLSSIQEWKEAKSHSST